MQPLEQAISNNSPPPCPSNATKQETGIAAATTDGETEYTDAYTTRALKTSFRRLILGAWLTKPRGGTSNFEDTIMWSINHFPGDM
jgi:hypothetical protein